MKMKLSKVLLTPANKIGNFFPPTKMTLFKLASYVVLLPSLKSLNVKPKLLLKLDL